MVRLTDPPTMTIAVDLGRKATKQTNSADTDEMPHPAIIMKQAFFLRIVMSNEVDMTKGHHIFFYNLL